MQKNENPIVLSLVLFVIAVVVAGLLSFTNSVTKDKIAENVKLQQDQAKQEVCPGADEFRDLEYSKGNVKAVFCAMKGEELQGWCVNVTPSGYGGTIDMMVGVTKDYKVSGVKVISNSETAGLGAKCTDDTFRAQYKGKDDTVKVIKNGTPKDDEIVAITGATITSKAVTSGVTDAVAVVKDGGLKK